MPDKMNLDYVKLRHCEFQKYEVMTMSVVGGQPEKHAITSYKATKHIERTFLISYLIPGTHSGTHRYCEIGQTFRLGFKW